MKNINYNFIAYTNSINIRIFPCKNKTKNNNKCKSKETIDQYLKGNDFIIALSIEIEILNIETNNSIIGFDFLTENKNEEYISYDTLKIIPPPSNDLNDETNTLINNF